MFFTILRTWYAENRNGNVTTADFIALAERVSGQQLDDFFHVWLYEEGRPESCVSTRASLIVHGAWAVVGATLGEARDASRATGAARRPPRKRESPAVAGPSGWRRSGLEPRTSSLSEQAPAVVLPRCMAKALPARRPLPIGGAASLRSAEVRRFQRFQIEGAASEDSPHLLPAPDDPTALRLESSSRRAEHLVVQRRYHRPHSPARLDLDSSNHCRNQPPLRQNAAPRLFANDKHVEQLSRSFARMYLKNPFDTTRRNAYAVYRDRE